MLSRVVDMKCLRSVRLKGNGMADECAEEIETLLNIKRIVRVDISSNELGKNTLMLVSRNCAHLEWLDVSRNAFSFEKILMAAFLNAVRMSPRLYHLQVDLQEEKLVSMLCNMMKTKTQIHSLGVIDTTITPQNMEMIAPIINKSIKNNTNHSINNLNLMNCYLCSDSLDVLLRSITVNNSLIRLNLSSNALSLTDSLSICRMLETNFTLCELQLDNNQLNDDFAMGLAIALSRNDVIQKVGIGRNCITEVGGKTLLECLTQKNDTLQSLGDTESNFMGAEVTQQIRKVLKLNRVSKEIRVQLVEEGDVSQVAARQRQAFLDAECEDYILLEPLAITNPLEQNVFNTMHFWEFD